MAFLGLAMILLLVYGIEFLETRAEKKNNKDIEEIHRRAYEWVDEHTDNPVLAVDRKAEIDKMIHDTAQSKGRKYTPPTLKEMTGEDLVNAVAEIQADKMTEEDLWYYEEHTEEEKREHLIQYFMRECGDTRESAELAADRFYEMVKRL